MSGDDDVRIGPEYPGGELARAFLTAMTHEDPATRERARTRVERWRRVLLGIRAGALRIGSRTPTDLPAWVTLEVLRGGFATGRAVAAGSLTLDEKLFAQRHGIRRDRGAIFAFCLTEAGVAALGELLDSGAYAVDVPEEAALLTVAWLLRRGDADAALALADELEPYAAMLRFLPRRAEPVDDPEMVWRDTAYVANATLARREPDAAVAAMNESLLVWSPFADELLALWLETVEDGRPGARVPDGWRERARALLARYDDLAAAHRLCAKHRKPKENLAILRTSLASFLDGPLTPRQLGLLRTAVDAMVARRGRPGSPEHEALRARQRADAERPSFHAIARVVVRRLAALPQDRGVADVDAVVAPVTEEEARESGVPAGTPVPKPLAAVVRRASAGRVEDLMRRGVVPSAEVLARLVPHVAAMVTAAAYEDPALRTLTAANYRAFRQRRSLLLLNLEGQVRVHELPWVRAVAPYRRDAAVEEPRAALVRLGTLALEGFPATLVPNALVRELDALSREARLGLPFVDELAADIFMGEFSDKFVRATRVAASGLAGSLYDRYYDVGYASLRGLTDRAELARLCLARAGGGGGRWRSVADNGTVIEQAQILTTQNVAPLVAAGVVPAAGWAELARRAFDGMCDRVDLVHGNPRPLRTVKDAAYAWRHVVLFLSLASEREQAEFVPWARGVAKKRRPETAARVRPVVAGLEEVLRGRPPSAGPFLGWSAGRHWMVS